MIHTHDVPEAAWKRKRTCLGRGLWEGHKLTRHVTILLEVDKSNNLGVQQKCEEELRGATKLCEINYQRNGKDSVKRQGGEMLTSLDWIRHGRRLHASSLEDWRRTGNDGRKEAVTNWQDRGCVVHQGRSDYEHFKVACNLKGTKWSWAHTTNNRALTTVRERATRRAPPRQHSKPCDITASKWPRADTQWTTDWHQSEKGPPGWGYIWSSESFEATESFKVSKEQEGEARKQRWGVGGGRNHESVAYGFGRSRSYTHIFSSKNKATLAFCESYWYKGRFPPAQGHKQTLLNVIHHVYHGPCVTVLCDSFMWQRTSTLQHDSSSWPHAVTWSFFLAVTWSYK